MSALMEPGPHKVRLCDHAKQRMAEMGLTREDVMTALAKANLDYASKRGRRVAVHGRLAVVYHPVYREVITVLWHAKERR